MSVHPLSLRQLSITMLLLLGMAAGLQAVQAQQLSKTEEIRLPVGSVFEVLAQEGAPQTQYAWVLSLERTFLEAGRGRSIRTRFAQPGRYLLSAEVTAPGGKPVRGSLSIIVESDVETVTTSGGIVETLPADENGTIALAEGQRLIQIRPVPGKLQGITLDADLSIDENGDGDGENDPSAQGTFLETDGLPLFLWITKDLPVTFALSGTQEDGAPFIRQYTASTDSVPPKTLPPVEEPAPVTGGIDIVEEDNSSLRFSVHELPSMHTLVLPLWDFGDGSQSMLLSPTHTFASSGTYVVRVRLKDLRNGIDIRDLRQSVTTKAPEVRPTPEEPIPVPEKPTPEEPASKGTSFISLLAKILAGLLVAAIIGAVITVIALKLRKGKSLADRLAEADKKMAIGKEGAGSPGLAPLPMALPAEPKKTPPVPAPPSPAGPVPSWLKDAPPSTHALPVAPPKAAVPAPSAATPTPAPTVAPVLSSSTPAASQNTPLLSDASIPDWLTTPGEKKGASAAPAAPVALSAPVPTANIEAPVKEPAKSPEASTPAPVPEAPKATIQAEPAGALPAWLQPQAPQPATAPAEQKIPPPAPVAAATKAPESPPLQGAEKPSSATPILPPISAPIAASAPAKSVPPSTPPPPAPVPPPAPISPKNDASHEPKPIARQVRASNEVPHSAPPANSTTPVVLSEKERERRRLKRQRYRKNKQRREATAVTNGSPATPSAPKAGGEEQKSTAPDDTPVAFIRAESIEQKKDDNAAPKA